MQKMEIDAEPIRRKNRRAEKMIRVYKHRQQHYKISFAPVFSEKNIGNDNGKNQVQKVMHRRPQRKKL